jgi:hypothetical protein
MDSSKFKAGQIHYAVWGFIINQHKAQKPDSFLIVTNLYQTLFYIIAYFMDFFCIQFQIDSYRSELEVFQNYIDTLKSFDENGRWKINQYVSYCLVWLIESCQEDVKMEIIKTFVNRLVSCKRPSNSSNGLVSSTAITLHFLWILNKLDKA